MIIPPLPAFSQQRQRSTDPSEPRFTITNKTRSTTTSLLPAKPLSPLPAKPDPRLTVWSQQSQTVREVRVKIPLLPACSQRSQMVRGENEHSTATSLLPVKSDPRLPAKPDPLWLACSQRSYFHPYQRSHIVTEARVRIPLLPAGCQRGQILTDESEHCTTTSLLPMRPDPLLPANPVSTLQVKLHQQNVF